MIESEEGLKVHNNRRVKVSKNIKFSVNIFHFFFSIQIEHVLEKAKYESKELITALAAYNRVRKSRTQLLQLITGSKYAKSRRENIGSHIQEAEKLQKYFVDSFKKNIFKIKKGITKKENRIKSLNGIFKEIFPKDEILNHKKEEKNSIRNHVSKIKKKYVNKKRREISPYSFSSEDSLESDELEIISNEKNFLVKNESKLQEKSKSVSKLVYINF